MPLFIGPDAGQRRGSLFDTLSIDATNPFNPFGVTLSSGKPRRGTPANYSFIARRLVEAGQRDLQPERRHDVGDGDARRLVPGRRAINGIGTSTPSSASTMRIRASPATSTRRASRRRWARWRMCTGACVPFNLFGGAGSITPGHARLHRLHRARQAAASSSTTITANLSGDLFDLPAGPVGFAIGYEHRVQMRSFDPDPIIAAGLGADIPAQPGQRRFQRRRNLWRSARAAAQGSAVLQLARGQRRGPPLRTIRSAAAARPIPGTALWKPVARPAVARHPMPTGLPRAEHRRIVRRPLALRPADRRSLHQRRRVAVPDQRRRSAPTASPMASPPMAAMPRIQGASCRVITQGNRKLRAGKVAQTCCSARVYSPSLGRSGGFASNFSLETNYYDIRVDERDRRGRRQPDAATTARCNGDAGELRADPAHGQRLQSTRSTARCRTSTASAPSGIDATFNYRTPATPVGTFGLSVNATCLTEISSCRASNGFVVINRKGTERGSPDQAFPKFKGKATIDWSLGGVARIRSPAATSTASTEIADGTPNRLDKRFYGDVQLILSPGFLRSPAASFTIGVNNVFNTRSAGLLQLQPEQFRPDDLRCTRTVRLSAAVLQNVI